MNNTACRTVYNGNNAETLSVFILQKLELKPTTFSFVHEFTEVKCVRQDLILFWQVINICCQLHIGKQQYYFFNLLL